MTIKFNFDNNLCKKNEHIETGPTFPSTILASKPQAMSATESGSKKRTTYCCEEYQ